MNVVINAINFEADTKLKSFIGKKLDKLNTFFDKIIDTEVFLKLSNKDSVRDKTVELKVHIPGRTIFVEETSKSFEESTDIALDTMARQIKKQKEKIRTY